MIFWVVFLKKFSICLFLEEQRVEMFRIGYSSVKPWWPVNLHNFKLWTTSQILLNGICYWKTRTAVLQILLEPNHRHFWDASNFIFILHSQFIVFSSPGTGYQEVLSFFPSRNGKIQYDHLKSNTVKTFLTFYGQSTMVSKQNSSINC